MVIHVSSCMHTHSDLCSSQPMFRREAVRLEFDDITSGSKNTGSAIKVSVGG